MTDTNKKSDTKRLLFILKKRSNYGISYGLANSCKFICNMLQKHGVECKVVEVIDNNGIDREVWLYKPTHVSIDALWVVPTKFNVLLKKYPKIKWSVRIHSKIPFLANEGVAMNWLYDYQNLIYKNFDNFIVASNAYITTDQLNDMGVVARYLPNIYCPDENEIQNEIKEIDLNFIDVGCFGSVRPLKNHLQQAIAAIIFGDHLKKNVKFHINSDRVEQHGEPILKNLEFLFKNNPNHELVKHSWMSHENFVELVKKMDVGLQVSLSESFNIVAADFVWNDIPIVGSKDIEWLSMFYQANPNDYKDIVKKLFNAYAYRNIGLQWLNKYKLWKHNKSSTDLWLDYLYEI